MFPMAADGQHDARQMAAYLRSAIPLPAATTADHLLKAGSVTRRFAPTASTDQMHKDAVAVRLLCKFVGCFYVVKGVLASLL